MSTTKLALVGAGVIGKRHLDAISAISDVELVGIVDVQADAKAIAEQYSVPLFESVAELSEQTHPHGIVVATPTEHHFQPTIDAMDAGAHVLVEKPLMATMAECEETIAKSNSTGKHVLVGHHRRYYELVNKAREIVQQGGVGQLITVSGQWNLRKHTDYYNPDWRKVWKAGPVLTNLIHDMDLLRYIAGDVVSITAEVSHAVMGYEKEDAAALVMRFANGALGSFILSDQGHSPWHWEGATGENLIVPRSFQNAFQFVGTEGALEFPILKLWKSVSGDNDWTDELAADDLGGELEDAYINQINHFADVINGRDAPRISAQDASDTLKATLAVLEAAKTGARVVL